MTEIKRLLDIMAQLRDPDTGCPWDLKQDLSTLTPYILEEAYEVVDAIERNDTDDIRDELGDLLLQVVFSAQLASEDDYLSGLPALQMLLFVPVISAQVWIIHLTRL